MVADTERAANVMRTLYSIIVSHGVDECPADRLLDTESVWLTPNDLRLMIAVGFTGAYTTFSTFEYETYQLVSLASWLLAFANVVGSVVAGFAGLVLAIVLVNLVFPIR